MATELAIVLFIDTPRNSHLDEATIGAMAQRGIVEFHEKERNYVSIGQLFD